MTTFSRQENFFGGGKEDDDNDGSFDDGEEPEGATTDAGWPSNANESNEECC